MSWAATDGRSGMQLGGSRVREKLIPERDCEWCNPNKTRIQLTNSSWIPTLEVPALDQGYSLLGCCEFDNLF